METAAPKAASTATPSQVFTALARIQQRVDAACGDGYYSITAEFNEHQEWLRFNVTAHSHKDGDRVGIYFPGEGLVTPDIHKGQSIKEDLSVILQILLKHDPTNSSTPPTPRMNLIILYTCDLHHSQESKFLHGVFSDRLKALEAIDELAPGKLTPEQRDLFFRIGQTQGYAGEGEWMTEEVTLDEISCRLD